jgi:D-alanyl-D-alanine carboxypeptidase
MNPAPPVTTTRTKANAIADGARVRPRVPQFAIVQRRRLISGALLAALFAALALSASACSGAGGEAAEAAADPRAADSASGATSAQSGGETETAAASTGRVAYVADAREVRFKHPLSAEAYIAIDAETGRVLIAHRDRRRLPIASLTKMMTALIVIKGGELGRKIQVPKKATLVEPNKEGLVANRWYQRKLLLYSALLESANDSAYALAYDAGGGSLAGFYRKANAKARGLGMTDTIYRSPNGLNDTTNLSSARDQAILGRAALQNDVFAKIVSTRRKMVKWPPPTYRKEWVNHNDMLFTYAGTYGIKTGWTTAAGGCLATGVRRNGHAIIAVILDSNNIWVDMPRLVEKAFARIGS